MKHVCWITLGLMLLAACGMPPPPAPAPAAEPAVGPMQPPPVFALIGSRERLSLTSEQITALDSIGRWNSSVNDEAMRELRLGDPRARRAGDAETDSLIRMVRQNNQQALDGVRSLLSDEQRQQVCELFPVPERREGATPQRRGQGAPRTGAPRGANDPGTGFEGMRRFVWPWCVTAPSPAATPEAETPPEEPPRRE